jgi:hypothetical protein
VKRLTKAVAGTLISLLVDGAQSYSSPLSSASVRVTQLPQARRGRPGESVAAEEVMWSYWSGELALHHAPTKVVDHR